MYKYLALISFLLISNICYSVPIFDAGVDNKLHIEYSFTDVVVKNNGSSNGVWFVAEVTSIRNNTNNNLIWTSSNNDNFSVVAHLDGNWNNYYYTPTNILEYKFVSHSTSLKDISNSYTLPISTQQLATDVLNDASYIVNFNTTGMSLNTLFTYSFGNLYTYMTANYNNATNYPNGFSKVDANTNQYGVYNTQSYSMKTNSSCVNNGFNIVLSEYNNCSSTRIGSWLVHPTESNPWNTVNEPNTALLLLPVLLFFRGRNNVKQKEI